MNREPFEITDLHGKRDIEIAAPLSRETEQFLAETQGRTSAKPGAGRRIECRAHDDDPRLSEFRDRDGRVRDIWLYPQKRGNKWVLCHFQFHRKPAIRLGDHVIETQSHLMIKDGWQLALEEGGGCRAVRQEHQIGKRTFDVWAETANGATFAIEADHSTRGAATAQRKDEADRQLGLMATVFCADRPGPAYADKVAHTELQDLPQQQHRPDPRHWPVTRGPRVVKFLRCVPGSVWNRCPEKGRGDRGRNHCGREHLFLANWTEAERTLSVADIGEQLPAGDLVVVRPQLPQRIKACIVRAGDARILDEYLLDRRGRVVSPHDDQLANRHRRDITADDLATRVPRPRLPAPELRPTEREAIVVHRRDMRERCTRCKRLTGIADGLCLLCRLASPEGRRRASIAKADAWIADLAGRDDRAARELREGLLEQRRRLQ